jgi:hypothetical protein
LKNAIFGYMTMVMTMVMEASNGAGNQGIRIQSEVLGAHG